jgi:hypothetical protein
VHRVNAATEGATVVEVQLELPRVQKLLDRSVQAEQPLVALDAPDAAEIVVQLRMLSMRAGISIYAWEPDGGLRPLRESGLSVPGSKRLTDALRYVLQSTHFGVYVFTGFAAHMKPPDTLLLRRISRLPDDSGRRIVFVDEHVVLPEELDGMFERLAFAEDGQRCLRLRDGRWVA